MALSLEGFYFIFQFFGWGGGEAWVHSAPLFVSLYTRFFAFETPFLTHPLPRVIGAAWYTVV